MTTPDNTTPPENPTGDINTDPDQWAGPGEPIEDAARGWAGPTAPGETGTRQWAGPGTPGESVPRQWAGPGSATSGGVAEPAAGSAGDTVMGTAYDDGDSRVFREEEN